LNIPASGGINRKTGLHAPTSAAPEYRMRDAPFLWMLIAALAISAVIVVVGW
jgi:hypothetical protein